MIVASTPAFKSRPEELLALVASNFLAAMLKNDFAKIKTWQLFSFAATQKLMIRIQKEEREFPTKSLESLQ